VNLWSSSSLEAAMAGLSQAERNCKRTGAPDEALSRHALLSLARRAMAR
jgi:DNA polymerase III subunit delta